MKIELAPEEYHKILTWNELKFYLFALTIDDKAGWRLPTLREYIDYIIPVCWHQDDFRYLSDEELDTLRYLCYPVRDLD